MNARIALPLLAVVAILAGACGAAVGSAPPNGASPDGASPAPTPTPIAPLIASPDEAAALVIAADPRFAGTIKLTPEVIGLSRWWESKPLEGGGFRIQLTIGWGDCPAGCINRHTWTYDVSAHGDVTFVEEAGDLIPPAGVPAG
jgi:hypothetical protein